MQITRSVCVTGSLDKWPFLPGQQQILYGWGFPRGSVSAVTACCSFSQLLPYNLSGEASGDQDIVVPYSVAWLWFGGSVSGCWVCVRFMYIAVPKRSMADKTFTYSSFSLYVSNCSHVFRIQ